MTLEELLVKQQYRLSGHAAVKICHYTKTALKGEGTCYKQKFYGIPSHRCLQMTPSYGWCTHSCRFCWRPIEESGLPEPEWQEPEKFMPALIEAQRKLLSGFKGEPSCERRLWEEAQEPSQVAISLAGEPTLYPFLPALIDWCGKRGMTTFLVSNGTRPGMMAKAEPTQLYMTLPSPDEETYKKTCRANLWSKIMESLELFPSLPSRRVIRLTLAKKLNMKSPELYAKLIEKAEPDYVEAKAYMHVGFSTYRMKRSAMPSFEEVQAFAERVAEESGYEITDSFEKARVVLLSRDGKAARRRIIGKESLKASSNGEGR